MNLHAAITVLNEANKLDPEAMRLLLVQRVPCNEALAQHPTIQVAGERHKYLVGPLGLINGMIEAMSGHRIQANIDVETGRITAFQARPHGTFGPKHT